MRNYVRKVCLEAQYTINVPTLYSTGDWIIYLFTSNADEENRIDFINTVFNFTITAGNTVFDIQTTDIIVADDVNEAEEQFLLVLELDSNNVTFDDEGGILVVTILDSSRK